MLGSFRFIEGMAGQLQGFGAGFSKLFSPFMDGIPSINNLNTVGISAVFCY